MHTNTNTHPTTTYSSVQGTAGVPTVTSSNPTGTTGFIDNVRLGQTEQLYQRRVVEGGANIGGTGILTPNQFPTTQVPTNKMTNMTNTTGYENMTGRHHLVGGTGMGTITFKPLEGKFNKDKDLIGKMDPYCKFKIGWRSGKSSVAKSQGVNPIWAGDAVTLKVKKHEFAKLKIKDKDRMRPDDKIGTAEIPLAQVIQQGRMAEWIPVTKRGVVTGEVRVEMEYTPTPTNF